MLTACNRCPFMLRFACALCYKFVPGAWIIDVYLLTFAIAEYKQIPSTCTTKHVYRNLLIFRCSMLYLTCSVHNFIFDHLIFKVYFHQFLTFVSKIYVLYFGFNLVILLDFKSYFLFVERHQLS